MKNKVKGSAAAIFCGFFYGIIPLIMIGVSRAGEVPGTVCSMYRLFFAGLITLPAAFGKLKKAPLSSKALWNLFLIGIASGVTALLLYEAFARIPSGIGISVHYIYPLTTLLFAVSIFKEKVSRTALPAALLVLAGVILLCDSAVLPEKSAAGLLLAFASAIACSIYYMLFEHLDTGNCDKIVITSFVDLSAALSLLVYNLCKGTFTVSFTLSQWGFLLLAGVFMVWAMACVAFAVRNVGTVTTTVLGTLEPIICTLGSALILKDPVSGRTLIGSALILSAVILVTLSQREKQKGPSADENETPLAEDKQ